MKFMKRILTASRNPSRPKALAAGLAAILSLAALSPAMAGDGVCVSTYSDRFPADANQFYATGDFVSYYTKPSMNGKSFVIGTWDKGSEPGFPVPYTPTPGGTTYMLNADQVNVGSYIGPKGYPTAYRGDFTTSTKADVWTIPAKENSFWWYVTSNRTLAGHPAAPVYSGTFTGGALSGYTQAERDAGLYPGWFTDSHMRTNTESGSYQVPVHIDPQQYATRFIVKNLYGKYLNKFDYSYSPDINVPDATVLAAANSNAAMLTQATIDRLKGYIDSGNVGANYLDLTPAAIIHNDAYSGTIGSTFSKASAGPDEFAGCGLFAEIVKHPRLQNVYMLKYFLRTATITGLAPFNRTNNAGTFIAYAPYRLGPSYLAPTLNPDSVVANPNEARTISPLDNDVLGSTGTLSLIGVSNPAHGSVTRNGNKVIYTPETNWSGVVTMMYTVTDGQQSYTSSITVTVTSVPPALNPDYVVTGHTNPITFNVLANDVGYGPQPLAVTSVTQPDHGTLTWKPDGTVTYVPEYGFKGTVTAEYTATDGATTGSSFIAFTTTICYDDVWHDAGLLCDGRNPQGSADFAASCQYSPPRYEQVEVACPVY